MPIFRKHSFCQPTLRIGHCPIYYNKEDEHAKFTSHTLWKLFNFPEQQRSWPIHEKECLAILTGIKTYANFLYGRHFIIQTDNISLTYIKSLKNMHGRLLRWSLFLDTWDFSIEYLNTKKNVPADVLSRSE